MPKPTSPSKKQALKKVDTSPPGARVSTVYPPPDTSTWITRNEAADLLSCAQGTLLNYERKNVLHPQNAYRADKRGVEHHLVVYDPDELTRLAVRLKRGSRVSVREPGEVAALATELFGEGKTNAEVVVALRVTFEQADYLRQKWLDATEARLVISPSAKEALEMTVGPFKMVTELVERVAELKFEQEADLKFEQEVDRKLDQRK